MGRVQNFDPQGVESSSDFVDIRARLVVASWQPAGN